MQDQNYGITVARLQDNNQVTVAIKMNDDTVIYCTKDGCKRLHVRSKVKPGIHGLFRGYATTKKSTHANCGIYVLDCEIC